MIRNIVHPQVLSEGILQFFPLFNLLWHPVVFHHQYLSFRQVIFRTHLQVSCNLLYHNSFQDSSRHNDLDLCQIILCYHFQVSVNISLYRHRHQNILPQFFQQQPVRLHILWPFLSSEVLHWNLMSWNRSVLLENRIQFGYICQKHIQVNFYLWCQVQVQIFGQQIPQVPKHEFWNHSIVMSLWPIFLVYIHVNIQKWSQVMSHSF